MKRIVCLTVAVLGSALVLHAEDTDKNKTTTGSSFSECISDSEYVASCDQDYAASDAVSADAQGAAQKTAVENMEGKYMGRNMGSTNQSSFSECISDSEYVASCDQDYAAVNDAASVDDQGTVQKTDGQNMEGTHMGTNMGSTNGPRNTNTWSYFNYEYE